MLPRLPSLSAVPIAIACAGALADRALSAPCPNYPYPSISGLCVGDGFCGLSEPEASATPSIDEPGALLSESLDPVALTDEDFDGLLAASGLLGDGGSGGSGGLALPERMAEVNAMLDLASPAMREALLVAFLDRLQRPVRR